MNYKEAIDYIHKIPKFLRPLGNANLSRLLELLGNPQDKLLFIHLAGTNGKGSTAAMLAQILQEQGHKTGLFTSPFIEVFNERIQINREMITDSDLAEYTARVKNVMEKNDALVSEFAFVTAIAFLYFAEKKCDYVVLETGMGGRLDATNVIKTSVVSVLTSIGYDHMQFLGDTIEEIALEKCGIIKQNGVVVSYPNTAVKGIIENCAKEMNAELTFAKTVKACENGFIYRDTKYLLNLKGAYQPQNAAAALEAVFAMQRQGIEISTDAIKKGLANVTWQARFEFVRENVVIDGGHNLDGICALKKSLLELGEPITLVMAMMEDKSYADCVKEIASAAQKVIATEIDMPRCLDAEKLCEIVQSTGCECVCERDIKKAIDTALENEGIICVCGSLYLAGEARKLLK